MDEKPLDLALLKQFSPLDGLKAENLHALAKKTSLRDLPEGKLLFKEGELTETIVGLRGKEDIAKMIERHLGA